MFTLLPGVGVELPRGAGTLRFGMSEQQAQWAVSTLTDVHEEWLCIRVRAAGVAWAFSAEYRDLTVSVSGGGPDDSAPGLVDVRFARQGAPFPTTPADVPVVFHDIDLFGYPTSEVEDALAALDVPAPSNEALSEEFGLTLRRPATTVQPSTRPDRKPRHAATAQYLVSATLTRPGRRKLLAS